MGLKARPSSMASKEKLLGLMPTRGVTLFKYLVSVDYYYYKNLIFLQRVFQKRRLLFSLNLMSGLKVSLSRTVKLQSYSKKLLR
mmetsp:Transcript_24855/g.45444  ORF Transcript_24855/g.45444 Transcript_24855/m.45444 type:complete len:84 (-) Transcript_24855:168-419(-)